MVCPVNSVTLSGESGASSGKAEDEGVAGSYVEDENAARDVIWLAGPHGDLRDRPLVLVGPTATGKSRLAHTLATTLPGIEIISVDSMCVYRYMDIGTAKPLLAQRKEVNYHMIDLVDPHDEYTVSSFQTEALNVLESIESRGHRALLVGGTGLYLRALTDGLSIPARWPSVAKDLAEELDREGGPESLYRRLTELDPLAASRITPQNSRRIIRALEVTIGSGRPFSSYGPGLESYPQANRFIFAGIPLNYDTYAHDIALRFYRWMENGLLDEAKNLLMLPGGLSRTARQALGYKELFLYLEDGLELDDAVERAITRTRIFARRQWRWFRRDPRIHWLDPDGDMLEQLVKLLGM